MSVVRDAIIYSVTFAINDFLEYGEKKLVFVCVKHSPNQKDLEKTNEDSNFFFKSNDISAVRIAYMMQSWTKEKNVAMKVLKYMYVYMQRTSVDNEISYCINFICTVYESDAVVNLITQVVVTQVNIKRYNIYFKYCAGLQCCFVLAEISMDAESVINNSVKTIYYE